MRACTVLYMASDNNNDHLKYWVWTTVLGIVLVCISVVAAGLLTDTKGKVTMMLTSKSFVHDSLIQARHTCDGLNISPALAWSELPKGTRSLALIVDDPDAPDPAAPKMTWVHWVLYNISPDTGGIEEDVADKDLPAGTLEGLNDWKRTAYGGPCPPVGKHRYFFKLYALDSVLPDLNQPTKAMLEKAMKAHVLEHFELIGLYQRQ
jgi:Raf kinase inhibitor-like YbhB/YbcL family protein